MRYWQGTLFLYYLVVLACRDVLHCVCESWWGAFILQNCLFACWQSMYCWPMMVAAFVSSYMTPMYLWLILYWADRLLCGTSRLITSYIWLLCGTGRLITSYIWRCCTLVFYGHINGKQELSFCYQDVCVEILGKWRVSSKEIGRCIVEGSSGSLPQGVCQVTIY